MKWTPKKTHQGKRWKGPMQYENPSGELMMLPSCMAMIDDEIMKEYVVMYARDQVSESFKKNTHTHTHTHTSFYFFFLPPQISYIHEYVPYPNSSIYFLTYHWKELFLREFAIAFGKLLALGVPDHANISKCFFC